MCFKDGGGVNNNSQNGRETRAGTLKEGLFDILVSLDGARHARLTFFWQAGDTLVIFYGSG